MRFHPNCYYRSEGKRETWPALIAAVTDNTNRITGIHRTWLDPAGGKAPLDPPRRALGQLLGNGVRFGKSTDTLVATEGIESALAIKTALPAIPVIAALSAAHLAALIPPPTVRRLYVAHDRDAAGRMACTRLQERFVGTTINIHPLIPRTEDVNADLLTLGHARFRAWLVEQLDADDIGRFLKREREVPA